MNIRRHSTLPVRDAQSLSQSDKVSMVVDSFVFEAVICLIGAQLLLAQPWLGATLLLLGSLVGVSATVFLATEVIPRTTQHRQTEEALNARS